MDEFDEVSSPVHVFPYTLTVGGPVDGVEYRSRPIVAFSQMRLQGVSGGLVPDCGLVFASYGSRRENKVRTSPFCEQNVGLESALVALVLICQSVGLHVQLGE